MAPSNRYERSTVPEFIDPIFVKTSRKRSFSVIQNERFGLVFVKTGSIISGTVRYLLRTISVFTRMSAAPRMCVTIIFRNSLSFFQSNSRLFNIWARNLNLVLRVMNNRRGFSKYRLRLKNMLSDPGKYTGGKNLELPLLLRCTVPGAETLSLAGLAIRPIWHKPNHQGGSFS